jgi:hypothetical protein
MKELLAGEEDNNHALFSSLLTALKPLMRAGMPETARKTRPESAASDRHEGK